MPIPVAPATLRIAHRFTGEANTDIVSRYFMQYTGAVPTQAQLNTFAGNVRSDFATDLAGFLSVDYTERNITIVDLSSAVGAVGTDDTDVPGLRGVGVSPLPESCCVILQYKIARRFRGGHGRGYWPFGETGDAASLNTWDPAFLTAVAEAFTDMIEDHKANYTALTGGTLTHVVPSFFHGFTNVVRPSGRAASVPTPRALAVIDPVISIGTNPKFGTQRRRLLQSP